VRHLTVKGLSAYMGIQVIGAFVGCVSAGYVLDAWAGAAAWLCSRSAARSLLGLTSCCPPATPGWCSPSASRSASSVRAYSGLAVYLSELYPTELRGAGQGFGYNIGRGIGAVGPAAIGAAAAPVGLSDALALAATSYGLCLIALLFLPETRGKQLTD
jgi:hypothetical protein